MHFLKLLLKSTPTFPPFINHWEHSHHILHYVVPCILCPLQSKTGARRVGSLLTHQTEAGVNKRAASCQSQEQRKKDSARPHTHWEGQISKPTYKNLTLCCTATLPPRPSWRVVPQSDNFCSNVIKGWRLTWQLRGSVTHYLPNWLVSSVVKCLIN